MVYYLVPIDEYLFVNPNSVANLMHEGPTTTRITYVDGRAQDRVEIPIQKLADILNGETMRYIITKDNEDSESWWCNVPGHEMHLGFGTTPEEAFEDARRVQKARENVPGDVELPFEEATESTEDSKERPNG